MARVVSHKGVVYCAKDPGATISNDGKGISYTEMDGDTNIKWWKNINYCQPNSKGFCHFDKDDFESQSEDTIFPY